MLKKILIGAAIIVVVGIIYFVGVTLYSASLMM